MKSSTVHSLVAPARFQRKSFGETKTSVDQEYVLPSTQLASTSSNVVFNALTANLHTFLLAMPVDEFLALVRRRYEQFALRFGADGASSCLSTTAKFQALVAYVCEQPLADLADADRSDGVILCGQEKCNLHQLARISKHVHKAHDDDIESTLYSITKIKRQRHHGETLQKGISTLLCTDGYFQWHEGIAMPERYTTSPAFKTQLLDLLCSPCLRDGHPNEAELVLFCWVVFFILLLFISRLSFILLFDIIMLLYLFV